MFVCCLIFFSFYFALCVSLLLAFYFFFIFGYFGICCTGAEFSSYLFLFVCQMIVKCFVCFSVVGGGAAGCWLLCLLTCPIIFLLPQMCLRAFAAFFSQIVYGADSIIYFNKHIGKHTHVLNNISMMILYVAYSLPFSNKFLFNSQKKKEKNNNNKKPIRKIENTKWKMHTTQRASVQGASVFSFLIANQHTRMANACEI